MKLKIGIMCGRVLKVDGVGGTVLPAGPENPRDAKIHLSIHLVGVDGT
jgi:hypothetical protein